MAGFMYKTRFSRFFVCCKRTYDTTFHHCSDELLASSLQGVRKLQTTSVVLIALYSQFQSFTNIDFKKLPV